jgi:(4S)-4-hydroxy-5-phosphonooxypentane-2,3-dione isomerase
MSQVSLFARFTAKEGKGDEIVAAFQPIIDQVRNEPGTLLYVMNRAKDNPDLFWFAELYSDDDAFAAHGASEAMANAMPTLGPLIAESELVVGEPVLAKDLPGLAL